MAGERYEVTAEGLNVRKEPSIHGKIMDVLVKGDEVNESLYPKSRLLGYRLPGTAGLH